MNKLIKKAFSFLICFTLVSNIPFKVNAKTDEDFITAKNTKFYDSNDNEYHIKSIGLGNGVWSSKDSGWQSYDHSEDTYKEIHDLGFNSVRYYFRYEWFEEKDKNGNPAIFERFDRDIAWAKKYGIKIYFNLHYAPTNNFGYHGYSMWKLNDNTNNMTNRNKVREMWEALAERYSNEDTILGWGLMNEPIPYYQDGKTLDEMLQPWVNTAKLFRDAIRKYDNNHILFVEPSEMLNNNGKYISYTSNRRVLTKCVDLLYTQVFKKDNNYCFEYHCYSPWSFSSKGVSGTTFQPLTENTLKARSDYLKTISDYIKKNSTPFLGEFGVSLQTMPCKGYEYKLTGIDFVNTTLDFCKEENVSFNYHQYRDNIFGLHSSSYKIMDNQDLYDIFRR